MTGRIAAVAWHVASAVTPTPAPNDDLETTGGGGSDSFAFFVVSILLALACIGIGLLMARQLRRMNRNYTRKVEDGELEPEHDRPASGIATSQNPEGWRGPDSSPGRGPDGGPSDGRGSSGVS
ncbi:hypothetical protein GCM10025864_27420 [Luteimicrobium album]|uniref:Uncharacterized protein n=1 Tax=Luteimicrobium album TaxID=1054550 RepID=A0ABQ6I4T1_9MICO|nr:hypothetical protein [Luteimicrobium album]GMA24983.1 hypothetical protein GCM10025864_27420 [Luteimicrobium album]